MSETQLSTEDRAGLNRLLKVLEPNLKEKPKLKLCGIQLTEEDSALWAEAVQKAQYLGYSWRSVLMEFIKFYVAEKEA